MSNKTEIYGWLKDEESKAIFAEYSSYVKNAECREWIEMLTNELFPKLKISKFIIYGMGTQGLLLVNLLAKNNLLENCAAIWDANPNLQGQKFYGIVTTPPPPLLKIQNCPQIAKIAWL